LRPTQLAPAEGESEKDTLVDRVDPALGLIDRRLATTGKAQRIICDNQ
jgi:hypothetical protein